jgi:hypothetical protein
VRRRRYERNPKHGLAPHGHISPEPKNGQEALDYSLLIKRTATVRVGIDYEEGEYVVLRRHIWSFQELPPTEIFHGYAVGWRTMPQEYRNTLMRAGMANLKGKIV